MLVTRILLLISLLAVGLYSQAPPSAPAQQTNIVTIRPRSTTSQRGIPEVKAVADRTRIPVGDQVTFILSPASVIKDPCYQVTLFFGDKDRQIMRQPKTVHIYTASGNYTYSILVRPVAGCGATPTPTPFPIPEVRLILMSSSIEVNQPLTFVAELSKPQNLSARNFSYRFVFDDGSKTGWQTEPKASHAYSIPKTYHPYVDIGLPTNGVIKQLGGSKRQTITVAPNKVDNKNGNTNGNQNKNQNNNQSNNRPNGNGNGNGNGNTRGNENQNNTANKNSNIPGNSNVNGNSNVSGNLNANDNANINSNGNSRGSSKINANATPQASATSSASPSGNTNDSRNDWWNYLIFLPLLMLAGYKAMTFFLLPRPTFVPHPTAGEATASGLAFDYQVDVDPNVDGAFNIDAVGGNLIKAKRTSDD